MHRLMGVTDPPTDWRIRFANSRVAALAELARPQTSIWLMVVSAMMVVAAAHGEMSWKRPLIYCGMIVTFACAASIVNNVLDAEIDGRSRLWRPMPAGRLTKRTALLGMAIPLTLGSIAGFAADWRLGVIGWTMLGATMLYNFAWRGSTLSFLPFALVGVLLPVGAIQTSEIAFPGDHLLWIVPVGSLAGFATFLIYKLPDFEMDDEDGTRSVLHWIGIDMAVPTAWAVVTAAIASAAAAINISGGNLAWLVGPLLYFIVVGLGCIWMLMRRVSESRLLLQRVLVVPMLPVLITCWLGAAASA